MNEWVVPGARCKCIDASWSSIAFFDDDRLPVEGGEYTVRDVTLPDDKTVCIRLEEIVNPMRLYRDGPSEARFAAWHFRPLAPTGVKAAVRKETV